MHSRTDPGIATHDTSLRSAHVDADGNEAGSDVGVIGDVHLDLPALRATLDGPLARCARLVCTGDIVDRGSGDPDEVLDLLLERGVELLAGNHELAYLGGPVIAGMVDDRSHVVARRLRDLVLDGQLRAATTVGDTLCVHGGVSAPFWQAHLRATCGADVRAIARRLNQTLLQAVARRDFRDAAFATILQSMPGPFWAGFHDHLLEPGLPPMRQVVGHVAAWPAHWYEDAAGGPGTLYPVEWGAQRPDGLLGHVRLVTDAP